LARITHDEKNLSCECRCQVCFVKTLKVKA